VLFDADVGTCPCFHADFNRTLALELKIDLPWPWRTCDWTPCRYHVPSFYNNFELVHVPWFRSPAIKAFNAVVHDSQGVWKYRWGDVSCAKAPLARSLAPSECPPPRTFPGSLPAP